MLHKIFHNELLLDDRIKPKCVLKTVTAINRYQVEPYYKKTGRLPDSSVDQLQRNKLFLQKAVYEWIRRIMYYTDFNLNDTLIHTMSFEFSKVLKMPQFYPDKDWIANFRATFNLPNANTKTMTIGYQESQSVRMQDILLYVKDVLDRDGNTNLGSIATDTEEIPAAVIEVDKTKTTNDRTNFGGNVDIKVEEENVQPSCSKMLQTPDVPQRSTRLNKTSEVPMQIDSESTSSQPVQIKPQTTKYEPEEIQPEVEEEEPEPETEPEEIIIYSHEGAISCVRLLEDFALLKENFRLIGLIERLEEALNE